MPEKSKGTPHRGRGPSWVPARHVVTITPLRQLSSVAHHSALFSTSELVEAEGAGKESIKDTSEANLVLATVEEIDEL